MEMPKICFINKVIYSGEKQNLTVYFNSGSTWKYFDITQKIYQGFLTSASMQAYYSRNIKGKYRAIKL